MAVIVQRLFNQGQQDDGNNFRRKIDCHIKFSWSDQTDRSGPFIWTIHRLTITSENLCFCLLLLLLLLCFCVSSAKTSILSWSRQKAKSFFKDFETKGHKKLESRVLENFFFEQKLVFLRIVLFFGHKWFKIFQQKLKRWRNGLPAEIEKHLTADASDIDHLNFGAFS